MKRSEINRLIEGSLAFFDGMGFRLPRWGTWSPREWADNRERVGGIAERMLGWDLTDFGGGRFRERGLILFTLRNGDVYAEKIMISRKDQLSPMHRHNIKAEDIINRGGGKLVLELFMHDRDGGIDPKAEVSVPVDGTIHRLPAGGLLKLDPGQSVTLLPGVWHAFWAEGKDVLIGEVSTVNDDLTDNVFREPIGRFADIDEDVAPLHLLVSDYEKWVG